MTTDTLRRACLVVVQALDPLDCEVTAATRLRDDLRADSLDRVAIEMAVEEEFGIPPITDDEAERLQTVGDIVKLVDAKLAAVKA